MQWHVTLAYIKHAITGNLDNQSQSKATNQAPVIWRKDDKQSTSILAQRRQSKHQYFGTKATNQEPVLSTICIHTNTFTGSLLSLFLLSSNQNLEIKHVSCGLKRLKEFLPSSRHLSLILSFTSLYSLYTCERHSIRNVSNLLVLTCWYAHVLNVLTLYVVTEVQSCIRPNSTNRPQNIFGPIFLWTFSLFNQ